MLVFNQTADNIFAGVISGTGSVEKRGAGVLTLTGASNYAGGTLVSAGTLLGDTTSLQGDVTNDAALVFDQAADGTFAGTVRGRALKKRGAGALTLTADHPLTGLTTSRWGRCSSATVARRGSLVGPIQNDGELDLRPQLRAHLRRGHERHGLADAGG